MIAALFVSLLPTPSPWIVTAPHARTADERPLATDETLDAKIAAAGKDVAKLLEIATACASGGQEEAARKIYKKVLELDPKNEAAHKGLRHQPYDGKWFESFAELSKYKREEAARMKQKGLVRFKDEWVSEADMAFLSMGWVKDGKGEWKHPLDVAREKQVEEWRAAGYQFRADDNSWIAPDDADKWKALLWKCGDEWVDMAKANAYHANLEHAWELMGEHFQVATTCDWEVGKWSRWHADKIHPELVRMFGVEPKTKPEFVVVNSLDQYNKVAGQGVFPETEGWSSLHGSYFADLCFDPSSQPPRYYGLGVCYVDVKDPKAGLFGPLWLRFAAAQSYVDAIDPSWGAIGSFVASEMKDPMPAFSTAFWNEKKVPRWLRWGAAMYVERFMKDPCPAAGVDEWAMRAGTFNDIKKLGGFRKLDDVFEFGLKLDDVPGSSRLYLEAGLVVAYLLDGTSGDKELAEKHEAFRVALKSGSKADTAQAVKALQKSLAKHERDIRKFLGN